MGSAHNIKLRVLRMRIIGMVLIGVIALLCSTNGWAESPTKDEIRKLDETLSNAIDRQNKIFRNRGVKNDEYRKLEDSIKKTLDRVRELAPTPCLCSEEALMPNLPVAPVIRCQCGEVICVINLKGGIFCPKQGLFK